jgi:hypothetical protein
MTTKLATSPERDDPAAERAIMAVFAVEPAPTTLKSAATAILQQVEPSYRGRARRSVASVYGGARSA